MKELKHIKLGGFEEFEKTILINDTGYFFDFLLKNADRTSFVKLESLKEDTDSVQVLEYPSYDDILKNFKTIVNSHCIVILNKCQEREIKLLSVYFKIQKMHFWLPEFLNFIGTSFFKMEEIQKLAETKMFFRLVFVFLKLRTELNLNPSNFMDANENQYDCVFGKEDFTKIDEQKYPETAHYLSKTDCFNIKHFCIDTFLYLMFYDLTGYKDEKISLILILIHQKDIDYIPKEVAVGKEDIVNYFMRKGIIFQSSSTTICLI